MKLLQRWKQTSLPNKLMFITSALVAFGTLFYAAAAVFQISILKESAEQTAQQNEKLITQIKEIAAAAKTGLEQTAAQSKAALDAAIENARLEQRAWVGAVEVINLNIKPGPVTLEVRFLNSGKTPAHKFIANVITRYMRTSEKFVPSYPSSKRSPGVTVIQPQMRISVGFDDAVLNQEEVDRIKIGAFTYYIFGKFTYQTISKIDGGGTFCMYIRGNLNAVNWCDAYNHVY